MKLFLDPAELRRLGMSEPTIRTLITMAQFIDVQSQLTQAQDDIVDNADSISTLQANDTALDSRITGNSDAISALDARIDAYDALAPFVRQDQVAAPFYAAYAGQTVSAAYVDTEAQATDDAVKAVGDALSDLITALQTANVLT